MASNREIKAVRKVLYERKRMRKLLTEVRSIDTLMNTDPNANLPPDDSRVEAGAGPTWFHPSTGEVDRGVLEAASRCKEVAQLLLRARRELNDVDFDNADKRALRNALEEHALAFVARAEAWSKPGPAADPDAAAEKINRHDAKALRSYRKVVDYLDRHASEGIL